MAVDLVMLSNHLIFCCPLLLLPSIFPSIRVPMSQLFALGGQSIRASVSASVLPVNWLFTSGGQSIRASASASVLPMNIQGGFPLRLTGLISLNYRGLSRVLQHHCSKAPVLQRSAFFMVQLSHPYMTTGKMTALIIWTFVGKVMFLLFNILYRFFIAFLPRSKCLLILWLQSPSTVILGPRK